MVVRTYAPVGKTPILKENLTRDHLSAMRAPSPSKASSTHDRAGTCLQRRRCGALPEASLMRQMPSKLLISYGTDLRSTGEGRSRTFWRAERLVAGCNWSRFLATRQISTLTRGSLKAPQVRGVEEPLL